MKVKIPTKRAPLLSHSMMSLIVTFLLVTQLLSKICSFMPQSQCNPPGRQYPLELSTFLQISLRERYAFTTEWPGSGYMHLSHVPMIDYLKWEGSRMSHLHPAPVANVRILTHCARPMKIGRQESLPSKDGIPLSYRNLFCTWYV